MSSQGYIVTNNHVVENCSAIDFSFGGQKHSALGTLEVVFAYANVNSCVVL